VRAKTRGDEAINQEGGIPLGKDRYQKILRGKEESPLASDRPQHKKKGRRESEESGGLRTRET